jgi:hypothetical protein
LDNNGKKNNTQHDKYNENKNDNFPMCPINDENKQKTNKTLDISNDKCTWDINKNNNNTLDISNENKRKNEKNDRFPTCPLNNFNNNNNETRNSDDRFSTCPLNNFNNNNTQLGDNKNPLFPICPQTQLNDVCTNELALTLEKYRIPVIINDIYEIGDKIFTLLDDELEKFRNSIFKMIKAHKFDYKDYYNKYLKIINKKDNEESSEEFKRIVLEEIKKNDMDLTKFIEFISNKHQNYGDKVWDNIEEIIKEFINSNVQILSLVYNFMSLPLPLLVKKFIL